MFNSLLTRVLTTAALALCVGTISASAQATRTWVSGVGDDVNPCSRTAPCKTWAGAISKTAAGGTINALDNGAFGCVTITKSMTLKTKFNIASSLASSGQSCIIVNAAATDKVALYGIDIISNRISLPGANGLRVIQAGSVRVEDVEITGFANLGIDFAPTNAGAKLIVTGSSIYG